jgi:PadR family transcriptional regulator, regulatory protein AphA
MSLRHAVLGLLAVEPATGYELTQRFDRSLAHSWHASHSQVYPQLAQLERAGLVEVLSEGPRRSRTWGLTDAGREELRDWLVEREVDRGQRNESGVRWFFFQLLDPDDRRAVIEREISYIERNGEMLDGLAAKSAERAGPPSPLSPTIDLGQRINAVMLDWLRDQLAALDAAAASGRGRGRGGRSGRGRR